MTVTRTRAVLLALFVSACGGGDPEPEYTWDESERSRSYEDDRRPPPPPREAYGYDDEDDDERIREYESREDEDRQRRARAATGTYGGPRARSGPEGAIFSVKEGVTCDESVRACYTVKGGHPGVTKQQFGEEASRRLARRIDEEGKRGPRAIVRVGDGIVCDRLSAVCYDREGATLRETRAEFGHDAAEDLADRIDRKRRGPGRRGGVVYSPRKSVWCDEQVAACYTGDAANASHTKQQFGAEAARDLERRIDGGKRREDGIYRPRAGVVCDRLGRACYDRDGVNVNATRDEFGRDAAVRLTERME